MAPCTVPRSHPLQIRCAVEVTCVRGPFHSLLFLDLAPPLQSLFALQVYEVYRCMGGDESARFGRLDGSVKHGHEDSITDDLHQCLKIMMHGLSRSG